MKRYITSGIRPTDDGNYVADYTYNLPYDIIDIVPPQLYKSAHLGDVYWFGYKFNPDVPSNDRTQFINYIKQIGPNKITDAELVKLIQLPLNELNKQINLYDISSFVYPLSGRSNLVSKMVETINRQTSRDMGRLSFELVKSAPQDIEFDWSLFESEYEVGTQQYYQMKAYIEDVLMPKIHSLDYFSLAHTVKPEYRKYIRNFLSLPERYIEKFCSLQGDSILVVDDINTSESTLEEILRILRKLNATCEIYIYTLIGN